MPQAVSGEAPLQDAVFVGGSVLKIFGVCGNHLLQFNVVTGALESQVRVAAPANATMRLVYHAATSLLYVSVWNEPNLQYFSVAHPNRDVYPINPLTLAVGARLNLASVPILIDDFTGTDGPFFGPRWIGSAGSYLYVQWAASANYYQWLRVNPALLTDRSTQAYDNATEFQTEQAALTPTEIYVPNPDFNSVDFVILGYNNDFQWDNCDMPPYTPVACEYCAADGLVYAVCGDENLLRINDPTIDDFDQFSLAALSATANPCRIRYRASNGLLYLPCMTANAIIVWDPIAEIGTIKLGFENPVDVVMTNARAFAVQNSPAQSLKEIT